MQVLSLDKEDPLEEGMAIHSSILAWKIPWTEFSGELHTVLRVTKSPTRLKRLSTHSTYLMYALMIHSVYIIIYFMHEDKV